MAILGFLFLLCFLYWGSRLGNIALGVISGLGLLIEVLVFRMPPSSPPVTVMLIILAVVTCASILEAAQGLHYLLQITEKILRKNPKRITLLGPLSSYLMTFLLGTGHCSYTLMPIVADIAVKNKIRPERPMAATSIAAQLGITASPISAAIAFYLTQMVLVDSNITLLGILSVTIGGTLVGLILMCLYSWNRGEDLENDPIYQSRMQDPELRKKIEGTHKTTLDITLPPSARNAVFIFIGAIVFVVILAMIPSLRTLEGNNTISMSTIIQIVMLAFGGILLIATKTPVKKVPEGVVFKSGMIAAIAIFGIAWMSNTFFDTILEGFKVGLTEKVSQHPWTFAFAMFIVSVVVNSQAATCKIMLPVGIALGLPPAVLIGLIPACYGYFFIPNYPTDIASITFDPTGTTKVGKYYFNHSFMAPGLVAVVSATIVSYFIAHILF